MKSSSNVKKSIILSGLIGTGGMFIAKLIGIVYAIPFSSILGSDIYMGIYGQAYNIYSYILSVFTAGFPFAIATMVARYTVLKDAQTVLKIRKLAIGAMSLMGLCGMLLMFCFAGITAPLMVAESVNVMANSLRILSLAVFFVPVLSAFRGFYQGRKEMEEYAFSQAFEQLFRVGFLLSVSCLFVYVLNMERKWALYVSVLSTSIAAIAGIVQFIGFDKKKRQEIALEAKEQESSEVEKKQLLKELFLLAVPYLVSAVFGYSQQIYNAILLPTGLGLHNYSDAQISTIISATNYVGVKITAIPMILSPGFTAAIIPHITEALIVNDTKKVKKNIIDCLNVILFIGVPISFCIFLYAKPIYYTLFYTGDLELSSYVLAWMAFEGFIGTLTPVCTNLMMSVGLKKSSLRRMMIFTILKGVILIPFTAIFGFAGSVLVSLICDGGLTLTNIREIKEKYNINFLPTVKVLCRLIVCVVIMFIVSSLLSWIGLDGTSGSKIVAFVCMCLNGILSLGVFGISAFVLKLPQSIFHIRLKIPNRG